MHGTTAAGRFSTDWSRKFFQAPAGQRGLARTLLTSTSVKTRCVPQWSPVGRGGPIAMPQVEFTLPSGEQRLVEAEDGASGMHTALSNLIPGIVGECGGDLSCAT